MQGARVMSTWRVLRTDDGTVRGFVRFADGHRLIVNPDGLWSVHDLDGRRLACRSADSAEHGMDAADTFTAKLEEVER